MSEKSVPKRQYANEFKVEAIRLAETVGQHEAARRLGVPVATLGNWSRRSRSFEGGIETIGRDVSAARVTRPISELEAENSRLRKELAKVTEEIARLHKKLSNEKFVANAPEEVVEAEREKLAEYGEAQGRLAAALERVRSAG